MGLDLYFLAEGKAAETFLGEPCSQWSYRTLCDYYADDDKTVVIGYGRNVWPILAILEKTAREGGVVTSRTLSQIYKEARRWLGSGDRWQKDKGVEMLRAVARMRRALALGCTVKYRASY